MGSLLENKVAVVTGGSNGIGLATVEMFIKEGAKVIVADIDDSVAPLLREKFGDAFRFIQTDVTSEDSVAEAVQEAVREFGQLDIMLNNAGAVGSTANLLELTANDFDSGLALLTRSVAFGHKHSGLQFKRQRSRGSIITTTSIAGLQGGWSLATYTIAKHAITGIIRQAASELGPLGIRSNAIAPGIILTDIQTKMSSISPEFSAQYLDHLHQDLGTSQPMGRFGMPEDIASVATFLASNLSSYVNGIVIPVDGGATATARSDYSAQRAGSKDRFLKGLCNSSPS